MFDDPNDAANFLRNMILQTLRQSHPQPLSSEELLSALQQQNRKLTNLQHDVFDELIQANLISQLFDETARRIVYLYRAQDPRKIHIDIVAEDVAEEDFELDDEAHPRTASRLDGELDDDTLPT